MGKMYAERDRRHRRSRIKIKLTKSESCIESRSVPEKLVKYLGILFDGSMVDKRNVSDTSSQ